MDDKEEVEFHLVGSEAGDPGGGGFEWGKYKKKDCSILFFLLLYLLKAGGL